MSASWRLARLRHLSSAPGWSLTAMSVRPASFRAATTFDPMNPAPPVTKIMRIPPPDVATVAPAAFAALPLPEAGRWRNVGGVRKAWWEPVMSGLDPATSIAQALSGPV